MYQPDTPTNLRTYQGPLNNRIDRVESVSNNFRVDGVPNHVQKTNVYVQENILLERTRKIGLIGDIAPNQPANFESLANSHTYKFPEYPSNLPRQPQAGDLCIDPLLLSHNDTVKFRRWALNRSFDRVQWRSDNSINSYDSQVYDTIELQPWLSHFDCTEDISRSKKIITGEKFWHDFQRDEEYKNDDITIKNMRAPFSYRNKVLFGEWPAAGDDDYKFEDDMKVCRSPLEYSVG